MTTLNCDRLEQEKARQNLQKVQTTFFGKQAIYPKDDFIKAQIYSHHCYNRLLYCFKFALHEEGLSEIDKSKHILKKYEYLISDTSSMLLSQMYILFYIIYEKWEEALHWINFTLSKNPESHKYSYISAQMWQLIIHAELENYQLLESLLRNTVRSWKKAKIFSGYLQKFSKILYQKIHQVYPEFWSDLEELSLRDFNDNGYKGVDTLYVFALSRVENKPIKELRKKMFVQIKNDHQKEKAVIEKRRNS